MDLQGKVIFALEPKTGHSARGEWKVQEYVIETHEAYPHKMVFSVFGEDRIQRFNIHEGQEVMVSFDIDAHDYNGRWFNSIRAYDVRLVDPATLGIVNPAATPQVQDPSINADQPAPNVQASTNSTMTNNNDNSLTENASDGSDDDLPF
jgi:hypothetical protein